MLFQQPLGMLRQYSEPLDLIFGIPALQTLDEGTEECPIILEGVTVQQFEEFLRWVMHL